jgi:hypothetical protein
VLLELGLGGANSGIEIDVIKGGVDDEMAEVVR